MKAALPSRVLSWYGDDFTGSTDVLEALAPYMPAVLFLRKPDEVTFARFTDYAAFGLAGSSRSESPVWMDENLPHAFGWLKSLGAAVCHYKVCSTFDSSPSVGNIGRAAEIGKRVFGGDYVPIVVGTPSLGRYTIFGNLFAAANGLVHRIDRHPTMSRHPVTPMLEADLRLHLRKQTNLRIELLDVLQLEAQDSCERLRKLGSGSDAVLIDVLNYSTLRKAGRLLWTDRQPFVIGSSGVEYTLIAYWSEENWIDDRPILPAAKPSDRIVVLSGSCSPVTQQQIQYAGRNGFSLVRLDVRNGFSEAAGKAALDALAQGRNVILYTSASPNDQVDNVSPASRQSLGQQAGYILRRVLDESGVKRIVIAGGDTSSHAGRELNIDALTFVSHLAPGAPLCRTWSQNPKRQDLEIVFKGGQCGQEDFFEAVLDGHISGRN